MGTACFGSWGYSKLAKQLKGVGESICFLQRVINVKLTHHILFWMAFPHGSVVKNLAANTGDAGSIPRVGKIPREGNGNPLQYPCLGDPMDRGAWWATGGHDLATKPQQQSCFRNSHAAAALPSFCLNCERGSGQRSIPPSHWPRYTVQSGQRPNKPFA